MNPDEEQLKLLRTLQLVYAGIHAVFSLLPLIHVGIGIMIVNGAMPMGPPGRPGGPPPELMGFVFIGVGALVIVLGETMAVMNFLAARFLRERKNRVFCMVIAGINCINVPLGTAIGVFSLVVLGRPGVRVLFDRDRPV